MYMVRPSPCIRPCLRPCRRPCLRPVCTTVYVPRIWPCTRPCTDCVHGRARAMYMAVRDRVHGRKRTRPCLRPYRQPCLRPVCTAVYVPCIWPCTRPFTACTDRVHRRATAVYIARPRPCTGYTYTDVYSVHGRVYGPCTRPPTAVYRPVSYTHLTLPTILRV